MAYIQVESSVSRNRKFVAAGPAASWLWLCGMAYCQEGLTDGFIPAEALPYLGVQQAAKLAAHLVSAGLWERAEGGWLVHDYLEHNKPAAEIRRLKDARRNGGKLGGRPTHSDNLQGIPSAHAKVLYPENPSVPTATTTATATPDPTPTPTDRTGSEGFAFDVAFQRLLLAYPGQGRCSSHIAMTAFMDVLGFDIDGPGPAFQRLLERLEGHKRSHQWRVKQMIPRLDKWLREGLHLQELPEHPPKTLVNDRTERTVTSGRAFVAGGDR